MYGWVYENKEGETTTEKVMSFKEVLAKEKEGQLDLFYIADGKKQIAVDFETGLFLIGGMPFDPAPDLTMCEHDYRIIYYKRSRKTMGFGINGTEPQVYCYFLGWQCTVNGTNHQRMMKLDVKDHKVTIVRKR